MPRDRTIRLECCPACGERASIIKAGQNGQSKYHAACNKYVCGLYVGMEEWSDTPEEAAMVWNDMCSGKELIRRER